MLSEENVDAPGKSECFVKKERRGRKAHMPLGGTTISLKKEKRV